MSEQAQPGLGVLDEEPGIYVFTTYKNVNIFLWVGSATGAITDRLKPIIAQQVSASPQGLSTVHVMTDLAMPPTAEARQGFAEIAQRWDYSIRSVSLVIEREGFWGSAMRSALTGIQMLLSRNDYPLRIQGSVADAVAWLPRSHYACCGVKLDPAILLSTIEAARARALSQAEIVAANAAQSI